LVTRLASAGLLETRSFASASQSMSSTLFSAADNVPYQEDNDFVHPEKLEPVPVLDVIAR
jgi:hypothetical protein